ncbi:hypothetical protein [Ilumatobacter nonamiensis]|uniref:hypothetical protein n=1 Tax=Ilumatobacter nonamiensis TaxID=467093 RepID=UPI00034DECFE|nr:hypothetical protein [Ilumatobacter nonamiensis]
MSAPEPKGKAEGKPVRTESIRGNARAGEPKPEPDPAAEDTPSGDTRPLDEVSGEYRAFVGRAMDRHEQRALDARRKVEAGEYGLGDWQRDVFAFGAQLWTDASEATGHLANLSRSRVDPKQN